MSEFDDVGAFHAKFGLPVSDEGVPNLLEHDVALFRGAFLIEELAEFFRAMGYPVIAIDLENVMRDMKGGTYRRSITFVPGDPRRMADAADAICDLNYVGWGTLHLMGLPGNLHWNEVQRANMAKVRASSSEDPRSKRGHSLDVVKPDGWTPPDHLDIVECLLRDGPAR